MSEEWDADQLSRVLTGDAASVESSTEPQRVRESLDSLHRRLDVLTGRVEDNDRLLREVLSTVEGLHRVLSGERNASQ